MLIGGNGSENNRSNAMTVTWRGDVVFAGSLRAETEILVPTVSVSTGVLGDYTFKRFGNVVDVILQVSNPSLIPSGQNIFIGTFTDIPLPPQNLRGTTYYGARMLGTGFSSATGTINLYNAYSSGLSGVSTDIHFTYIVD